MKRTITDKLLDQLNARRGKSYPDIGYSFFADVKGDGRNIRSVWTIINEWGGVMYSSLNDTSSRKRCANIRRELTC